MGISSIWHWLIVLVVVMLIFGTKKITSIGSDLGKAVKGFKDGMNEGDERQTVPAIQLSAASEKDNADVVAKAKSTS